MRRLLWLLLLFSVSAAAQCAPPNYYGPPFYPCGSPSTTNPGQVSYYFQSNSPQGTVNTSNSAISPCTSNCLQWVSGDHFITTWQTGVGAGNGGNILLGGGVGTVNTSGTSVTWVSGTVFSTAWSGTMTIAGVNYTISSCTSTTACTLTTSAGTLTGAGYSVKGTPYGVSAWNSATVATLTSAPGTQTGVTYMDHTACKPITALDHGSGCQNSVSHDPTLPGYVGGSNLITQIADQSTGTNGQGMGQCSSSGGDNDHGWSRPNETYVWCTNGGGQAQVFQISTALGYAQVVNSWAACGTTPPGVAAPLATGITSDTRYYHASGSQVLQADLTGSGCTLALGTDSLVVDFMAAGKCPGISGSMVVDSILGVSGDGTNLVDDTFTAVMAPSPGGQGKGDWTVNYSQTKGCAATNWATGQVWAFCTSSCTSSTPALGTFATGSTNCWGSHGSTGQGLHNVQADTRGKFDFVSGTGAGAMNQGGCTGPNYLVQQTIGTLGNVDAYQFNQGDHQSVGIDYVVSNRFNGWSYAANNNIPNPVSFLTGPLTNSLIQDAHNGLPDLCNGYMSDNCAWIGASDTVNSTQGVGCTGSGLLASAVYCPAYPSNALFLVFPFHPFPSTLLTFGRTGSCGGVGNGCADQIPDGFGSLDAIGMPSPKGDMFIFVSTMWHQLGYDKNAAPYEGAFILYFGKPQILSAPCVACMISDSNPPSFSAEPEFYEGDIK